MNVEGLTYITDFELELIHYIERYHSSMGQAPSDGQLNQRFELNAEALDAFKANPLVQKSLKARGIFYPAAEDTFSPEQMHAAAAMMDTMDRRSDAKKLNDIGVTTRQWSAWLQDDKFAEYLRNRSEKLLANSIHEAHKGLMKGVRNGNVASVKTFYEITGRYRPDQDQQVDLKAILFTFIEVIQRYVKDPAIIQMIAMDLSAQATAETVSSGLANQIIGGQKTFQGAVVDNFPAPMSIEGTNGQQR